MLAKIGILAGAGFGLSFIVANIVDAIIFRLVAGPGDPMANILASGPSPRRSFVLNVIRPVVLTLIIFGGGLMTVALLGLGTAGIVAAGVWFFLLTQYVCLVGRTASLNQAGWAMVVTMAALIAAFVLMTRPTLTRQEEEGFRNFARSIRQDRRATLSFNQAVGPGSGVVTVPAAVVEEMTQRRQKALELSRSVGSDVLCRVHPELGRMVRDHYEKHLEFEIQALRMGDPMASLESQRHQNAFADWWDAHTRSMPLLVPFLKEVGVR